MAFPQKKLILTLFTLASLIGAAVALYIGYELFKARLFIFWVFAIYILLLTGIILFFGVRLIGMALSKND